MAQRFSRIRQGAYYNQGLTNYINYLQTSATRPRRIGQQGPRNLTLQVYITPFGFDIATDELVPVKANPDSYTALSTYINGAGTGAQVGDTLGANTVVTERGFRAARVVWFRNATRAVNVTTSDITGLQYLNYTGDRDSCPFGRNTATDDQIDAFNAVKAAVLQATAGANSVNRVSLSRERAPV
ncbi:MAG: hypothetical protein AAF215_31555 [Cyanobacteria bacterium P01_A01_bin.123]